MNAPKLALTRSFFVNSSQGLSLWVGLGSNTFDQFQIQIWNFRFIKYKYVNLPIFHSNANTDVMNLKQIQVIKYTWQIIYIFWNKYKYIIMTIRIYAIFLGKWEMAYKKLYLKNIFQIRQKILIKYKHKYKYSVSTVIKYKYQKSCIWIQICIWPEPCLWVPQKVFLCEIKICYNSGYHAVSHIISR